MRYPVILISALLTGTVIANGSLPPNVVGFGIRGSDRNPVNHKREDDSSFDIDLENRHLYYAAEIEVGTPGQKMNVLLDTGSSDLWVISKDNEYCASNPDELNNGDHINCKESGTFDPSKSSTFKADDDNDFSILYGDTTVAKGSIVSDNINIDGTTIRNVNFGVANDTNSTQAVFGIGLQGSESSDKLYDNFPMILKKQKMIDSTAYSLWLSDPRSKQGSVLFGGVDQKKYSGRLETVPIVKNDDSTGDSPTKFFVVLSGVSLKQDKNSQAETVMTGNVPVLLDSGTWGSTLPKSLVDYIVKIVGCRYDGESCILPCSNVDKKAAFEFNLSGKKIQIPFSDMITPSRDLSKRDPYYFSNDEMACELGLTGGEDSFILGDSFLRSAYVVYDLENLEIGLAQTAHEETDSDIVAIRSSIPNAKRAQDYHSTKFADQVDVNTKIGFKGATKTLDSGVTLNPTPGKPGGEKDSTATTTSSNPETSSSVSHSSAEAASDSSSETATSGSSSNRKQASEPASTETMSKAAHSEASASMSGGSTKKTSQATSRAAHSGTSALISGSSTIKTNSFDSSAKTSTPQSGSTAKDTASGSSTGVTSVSDSASVSSHVEVSYLFVSIIPLFILISCI